MSRTLSLKMALTEASWKTQLCLKTKLEPKARSTLVTGKGEIDRAEHRPTSRTNQQLPHPIHTWIFKTPLWVVDTASLMLARLAEL